MSNARRSNRYGTGLRTRLPGIAAFAVALLSGLAPASAGVSLAVTPVFPATVTAAATGLAASLAFANSSTGPDAAFSMSITAIALTPSCGHGGSTCIQPDPGVFALSATGTGQAGSACAGAVFTIGAPDAAGRAVLTPSPPVVLAPTGQPGSSCTIHFTFGVLKVPTIDASNPTPGVQTDPVAEVSGVTIGNPGSTNSGNSTELTVARAQPTIATTASPAVILGGAVSDTAQLASGSNPGGGSVTFHLYGPNDATCSLPQTFVSTNSANASGTATSSPFTPTATGTYRWIAAYAGDPDNLPVQGACNDANESVVVSLAPPSIAVLPTSLASNVPAGGTETLPLGLENQGGTDLLWTIGEAAPALAAGAPRATAATVFDNGPLVTHPGGGFGGDDASAVASARGLALDGFGLQLAAENRLADDFTVPGPASWRVDRITFYLYQTGSTTTSTIRDLRVQIWDGPPGAAGSRVVFGDRVTNRLLSSGFANIYRVPEDDLLATTRPIFANVAELGATLAPGTYWLDWSAAGTLGSGPWAPPVAIRGQAAPGNSMQSSAGEAFAPALDGATRLEFPFRIEAALAACDTPTNLPWVSVDQTLGTTVAGATTPVNVTFDAAGQTPGTYLGILCLHSNDPVSPVVEVPLTFVVAVLFLDGFETGNTSHWSLVVP